MELLDEPIETDADKELKGYLRAKKMMKFFLLIYVFIFLYFWNRMKFYFEIKKMFEEEGPHDISMIPHDLSNGLMITVLGFFSMILLFHSVYKYGEYISADKNWLLFLNPVIALVLHYLLLSYSRNLIYGLL